MRKILIALVVFPCGVLAAPPRTPTSPSELSAKSGEAPAPGACGYVQPGVKVCSALANGQGAFDVYTFMPAVLYVRTEEPIVRFVQPDPRYFQADLRENTVVIIPTREQLPERTPAIISTKTLTITLNVCRGTRHTADTQLTVLDPLKAQRNAQLARAVADAEPQIVERLHAAELAELAQAGAEVHLARGKTIDRNAELIVLRAKEVVHFGRSRFLLFTLENRSADPFQIRIVRVWHGDHETPSPWKMAKNTLAPSDEMRGVVELGPSIPRVSTLKLRVEEVDPRRNVELRGVEIR